MVRVSSQEGFLLFMMRIYTKGVGADNGCSDSYGLNQICGQSSEQFPDKYQIPISGTTIDRRTMRFNSFVFTLMVAVMIRNLLFPNIDDIV